MARKYKDKPIPEELSASKKKPVTKKPISRSSFEAAAGILLAIFSLVFPMTWWLKTLLILIVAVILIWIIYRLAWTINFRSSVKVLMSILALGILTFLSWDPIRDQYVKDHTVKNGQADTKTSKQAVTAQSEAPPSPYPTEPKSKPVTPKTKLPDVTLRFIYAKEPALVIVNRSDTIARDIKWTLAIWNMNLAERNDPLPIPVSTFDWLRPHTESGPLNLFGNPLVAPLLKPGDHLFGSASISCPDCFRGRTYVIYIVYGQSGWYSEIKSETSGSLIVPKNFLRDNREAYFRKLEAMIPQKNRIPITDPELKPFKLLF